MANLLAQNGAQVTNKQPKWTGLYTERFYSGLVTNRSPLSDILSDVVSLKYYGGKPEALTSDSLNTEISNQLSLIRRYGFSKIDSAMYAAPPTRVFSMQLTTGALLKLVDTTASDGSGALYLDNAGTLTTLVTKPAGSGQGYGIAVANVFYYNYAGGAGFTYTPLNTNGTTWSWGITAPTVPPAITVTPSGSAAVTWSATTFFSTMGLVYDASGTGEIFQLVSVNASGTNSTQYATTSNGQPLWNQTVGGTTPDNGITWTNKSRIQTWKPLTQYSNATSGGTSSQDCIIYDPSSNSCYITAQAGTGVTSAVKPTFSGVQGSVFHDGTIKWFALPGTPGIWIPSHSYVALGSVTDNDQVSGIVEPTTCQKAGLDTASAQIIYWQTSSGGTSGTGGTSPFQANTAVGTLTNDGTDIQWLNLGTPTWLAGRTILQFTTFGAAFTAIIDSNNNFQVAIVGGVAGASAPTWETKYGAVTKELTGTVQWICVGSAVNSNWTANVKWYLPSGGFTAPTQAGSGSANPYGSAIIVDSNSNLEAVITSGLSKTSTHPAWATALNSPTTDGTVTWRNVGVTNANSLSWTVSHTWAYSYKSRSADDFYSTPDAITGAVPVPPGANPAQPLPVNGVPTGSGTGDISTASPVTTLTGANAGAVVALKFPSSTNPAVDTIVIWRDADGGGAGQMFELTEIPNPPPINGQSVTVTWQDYLPDTPTSVYPGLNNQIPAPIDDQNDPPPTGFLPQAYWFGRIWGSVFNQIFFSGGPDVLSGNPNSAFQPSDEFEFLAPVVRLVKTSSALIVFLTDSIEAIQGGPTTASFSPTNIAPGLGLGNYNGLDVFAGEIMFLANSRELMVMTPNLQLSGAGFAIADRLALYDPTKAYVAYHTANNDSALYVSDGSSEYYRCNVRQAPFGTAVWSPRATPINGIQLLQSVETSAGVKQLLIGSTLINKPILFRDLTSFTDDGTAYEAYATVGSIILATSPHFAITKAIDAIFTAEGDNPTVSVLVNEVEADGGAIFNPLTLEVSSPPFLYGDSGQVKPKSYNPLRWYFSSNPDVVSRANFFSLKIDFGGINTCKNECISFSVTGKLMAEY